MGSGASSLMEKHLTKVFNEAEYATQRGGKITHTSSEYKATVSKIFLALDKDESGYIDEKELTTLEKELGKVFRKMAGLKTLPPNVIRDLLLDHDCDEDGRIDYDEFASIMDDIAVQISKYTI